METDDESDDEVVVEETPSVQGPISYGFVLESEEAAFLRDVTQRAMSLDSVNADNPNKSLANLMVQYKRNRAKNKLARINKPDDRTVNALISRLKLHVGVANIKNKVRQESFLDVRNALAHAGVTNALWEMGLDPTQMNVIDDVSILINPMNGMKRPTAITTQEARDYLQSIGIAVSVTEEKKKQRVMTFNLCLNGSNCVITKIIKFWDRGFPNTKEPFVFEMDDNGLFVILYNPLLNETILTSFMYEWCIIPKAHELKKKMIDQDIDGLRVVNRTKIIDTEVNDGFLKKICNLSLGDQEVTQVDDGVDPYEKLFPSTYRLKEDEIRQKYKITAFMQDGAYPLINAVTNHIIPSQERPGQEHRLNDVWGKHAGGCSMTQAANDSRDGPHSKIHAIFRSKGFRWDDNYPDPQGQKWVELKSFLLKFCDGESFKSIWKAFCHAGAVLDRACSTTYVEAAFENVGVITRAGLVAFRNGSKSTPSDDLIIMNKCPVFHNSITSVAQKFLDSIPSVTKEMINFGYCHENAFDQILDETREQKRTHLNDQAISRGFFHFNFTSLLHNLKFCNFAI